jgi:hypothetical protein
MTESSPTSKAQYTDNFFIKSLPYQHQTSGISFDVSTNPSVALGRTLCGQPSSFTTAPSPLLLFRQRPRPCPYSQAYDAKNGKDQHDEVLREDILYLDFVQILRVVYHFHHVPGAPERRAGANISIVLHLLPVTRAELDHRAQAAAVRTAAACHQPSDLTAGRFGAAQE